MTRAGMLGLLALLIGVGTWAWWLELQPELREDPASIASLSSQLGGWVGRDLPMEMAVESMLNADFNVMRIYEKPDEALLWLYVGYYSTPRGGTPEHVPLVCYHSNGWDIEAQRVLPVPGAEGLQVNELVVANAGRRRLVHYWFRSFRRTSLLTPFQLELDHAAGRLLEGRADGSLVRISTPLSTGGIEAARRRLFGFTRDLEPELDTVWPQLPPVRS